MAKHSHEVFDTCSVTFCLMVVLFMVALALTGCEATVKHEVPQLEPITKTLQDPEAVSQAIKKIVVKDCQKPTLKMRPIAQDVIIDIKGDVVTANDGGVAMLQDYVKAQKVLAP